MMEYSEEIVYDEHPDIQVFTRSHNDILYTRMREFIPEWQQCVKVDHLHGFSEAADFLYHAIDNANHWLVVCDEDCYIHDFNRILDLVYYMRDNNIDYCGMPDGGVHTGRSHQWFCMNPFFLIINAKKVRDFMHSKNMDWGYVTMCNLDFMNNDWAEMFKITVNASMPSMIRGTHNYTSIDEPFSGLFFFLFMNFCPLYIDCKQWANDDVTCELVLPEVISKNRETFCTHTWYSRLYIDDEAQTERIDSIYEMCKQKYIQNI